MALPFFVSDEAVAGALTWKLCIDSARDGFAEQAACRIVLTTPRVDRLTLKDPDLGDNEPTPTYRLKGAAFKRYGIAGLRAARVILLSRWPTLEALGVIDEKTNYAWRVGAVTAAALEALQTESFERVALFGAGRLACTTLAALAYRYQLGEVTVLSRTETSRKEFINQFGRSARGVDSKRLPRLVAGSDPEAAVRDASLIVTMTTANHAIVHNDWVADDAVVVSMGGGQELDFDLLERARGVYVDDLEGCLESGDLSEARRVGRYREGWVSGTIADLLQKPDAVAAGDGPVVMIPRGMASMDVLQAYRVARALSVFEGTDVGKTDGED